MLNERATAMDDLCSAIPGAITAPVREQLENARMVSVINETTCDEIGDFSFDGETDFDLVVAHSRVSRSSGGQLFRIVKILEVTE